MTLRALLLSPTSTWGLRAAPKLSPGLCYADLLVIIRYEITQGNEAFITAPFLRSNLKDKTMELLKHSAT